MEEQYDKLNIDIETWNLVHFPDDPNVKILPGKWVYDLKLSADGDLIDFRARWVIYGNYHCPGPGYDQTYALEFVVTESGIKMVLTAIALKDLEWEQVDVVIAYLNTSMRGRTVHMRQPSSAIGNLVRQCSWSLGVLANSESTSYL
jgi:Reverse transcriptase (RNA-dependent DNA polymerase)